MCKSMEANVNMNYQRGMASLGKKSTQINEAKRMLHDIGMIDFVVVEMAEYLDTHPKDKEAIDYFNYYAKLKNNMMQEFADKYWPLTLATADNSQNEWTWALQEPPWKGMGK